MTTVLETFPVRVTLAIRVALVLAVTGGAISGAPGDAAAFTHPGIWQTEVDLERVRANVAAGKEPWRGAWEAIAHKDTDKRYTAHPASVVTNAYELQNDGHAAYVLAIKWVASGDIDYAHAAEKIIETWVDTVRVAPDTTMRNGLGANQMAAAADILAHGFHGAANWAPADVAKAKIWFKTVIYPRIRNGASANWGTSCIAGLMAMAIFCDDRTMFDEAVAAYRHGFVVNGSLKDGCSGVTQYIDATGEDAESGRDQAHSQGGIAHLVETALAALNQGVDLVHYNDAYGIGAYGTAGANRLFIGLEYTAKYNLGGDVGYHPFLQYCSGTTIYPHGVSDKMRGHFSPVWEMTTFLFRKAGLKPAYSALVLAQTGYRPEPTNSDHPGLGTLLFATGADAAPIPSDR